LAIIIGLCETMDINTFMQSRRSLIIAQYPVFQQLLVM